MARKRRRKTSTSQQIVGMVTSALPLPEPAKAVLRTRLVSSLLLIATPILLITGILQIQWQDGRPRLSLDRQKAAEIRDDAIGEAKQLGEHALGEAKQLRDRWEPSLPWRQQTQSDLATSDAPAEASTLDPQTSTLNPPSPDSTGAAIPFDVTSSRSGSDAATDSPPPVVTGSESADEHEAMARVRDLLRQLR
jgi:hypothetical protein